MLRSLASLAVISLTPAGAFAAGAQNATVATAAQNAPAKPKADPNSKIICMYKDQSTLRLPPLKVCGTAKEWGLENEMGKDTERVRKVDNADPFAFPTNPQPMGMNPH